MLPRGRAKGRQFVGILNFPKDFCQKPLCQDNMYVDIQVIYFLYFVSPGGGGGGGFRAGIFYRAISQSLRYQKHHISVPTPPPPPTILEKKIKKIIIYFRNIICVITYRVISTHITTSRWGGDECPQKELLRKKEGWTYYINKPTWV